MENQKNSNIVTDEDLIEINKYSTRELTKDELFVFNVSLCNNDIDRDFEKFSLNSLTQMANLFVGKTGISDHSMKSADQRSRIFKTWVEKIDGKKTTDGEDFYELKARAYMLNNYDNQELIQEIEAGIKKEVSISCSMKSSICSICGNDVRNQRCEHLPGRQYMNDICFRILENPVDAYEFSFVAVPAQREAGVTKTFDVAGIEKKMENGRQFRNCDFVVNENGVETVIAEYSKNYPIYEDKDGNIINERFEKGCFDYCDFNDFIFQYNHSGEVFARKSDYSLNINENEKCLSVNSVIGNEKTTKMLKAIKGNPFEQMGFSFLPGEFYFDKKTQTIVHTKISKIYGISAITIDCSENAEVNKKSFLNGELKNVLVECQKEKQRLAELVKLKTKLMGV